MKKLLVTLLALALVLPMALVQPAKAEVEKQPFYTLGWSDFDQEKYPYLDGLLTTSFTNIGEFAKLSYGGGTMLYGEYTDEDVTAVAQAITKEMKDRPAGTRYWTVFGPAKIMQLAPDHAIFLEHGVVQLQQMFTDLVKKLYELGCPLDGVVIDIEYIGMGAWYLYTNANGSVENYGSNKKIYAQIVADKRYQTMIRPLLVEYGFPFWPNPSGNQSEIYSICYLNKGEQYDLARNIWNTVMRIHLNNYSNIWCYEPLKTYYPDASLSDYQSHDSKSWLKLSGITDDGVALSGGNSVKVGTASSFSYYYARPGSSFFDEHKQYVSFNDGEYEASAFNGLLYDVNFTRHMYSSTDTKQIAPWITYHTYGGKKASSMAYTPYYTELLYHLGMFDPEPFLSYTYVGDSCFGSDKNSAFYHTVQKVQNEIMAALTEVAGYADRKPIEMPQYWNAEYVVSGMYANGRNIWRITPNGDEISLADFKVKDSDPTFSVKGQTITFPGGKILEEATISEVGSCGYWVETAANVTPVMTADADRYAKYPTFGENFDSYAEGASIPALMKSGYAWSNSLGYGATANIVSFGGGKGLALTGSVTYKNSTIPAKITAGDSYAEDQTWELTVNIPEGLSADAVIQVLKYTGEGQKAEDSAIKYQNGKFYYSKLVDGSAEYAELASVKAGTYTVKRVMNFNDAKKFTYSVYLLDADRKEVASAKDVECPTFTTISTISFMTKDADKTVTVDDYKLYPSGTTTDFELYDGSTGINVKGDAAETHRDRSTAYRLSWLNGTQTEKTYTVMAEYYQGGKLSTEKAIKTVTMKPGCDGVETGVVTVASGQSVRVYLKEGSVADATPTTPTTATTATSATKAPTAATQAPTSATKAPTAATSATKATAPNRVTVATKAPTSATKAPSSTTKPGETLGSTDATQAPDTTEATQATEVTVAPTEETLAPTEESKAPDATTETPQATEETTADATQATTGETADKENSDDKGGSNLVVIIVIVAVVLAGGGAAAYFLVFKKKKA